MNSILVYLIVAIVALAIGAILTYYFGTFFGKTKLISARTEAKKLLEEAEKDTQTKKRELLLEAKEEVQRLKTSFERDSYKQKEELRKIESRILQKEDTIYKKTANLEAREQAINRKESEIARMKEELQKRMDTQKQMLEKIARISEEEAKEVLFNQIREETKRKIALIIKDIEERANEEGEKRAKKIISQAIQRYAASHVADTTTSVVPLPSDEMKGRIIGREGRNIRHFEAVTGMNLIIDDTPEAVVISGFDPERREIARITLEKLILDSRIHPARIEEMYEKAKAEVDKQEREAGEAAIFETRLQNINAELLRTIGRLKFRTSFGQNVYTHSLEVAYTSAMMANELGVDAKLAKRAGLLHDIGKVIDQEVEGPHAIIGAELAKKLGESEEVCHIITSHHGEVEPRTVEAFIVSAADALSAARPGARRETMEKYIKRLENLEAIASSFPGVEKVYAMQAGREIRIMVKPEEVDDAAIAELSQSIAARVERELEYPGQIKVMVIRESRSIEYAK